MKTCWLSRWPLGLLRGWSSSSHSGQDALAETLEHDFAAVLLDVQMPEMDGFEVARLMRLKEKTRLVPIIFLTAMSAEGGVAFEGYEAGAVDFMTKPFDKDILCSKLQVFIDLYRQRRRIEDVTRELERSNKDLEQFAYMISHDLQEPLRVVANFTGMLSEKLDDQLDPDGKEYMGYILDGTSRMKAMIQGMLQYSRVSYQDQNFGKVALDPCLDDALENLALAIEDANAEIEREPLPEVWGDAALLTQLLQNLVSNAIKYRGDHIPHIHIGVAASGVTWHVTVKDNGIGMDSEKAEQAFTIFRRLVGREEYAGSGIGLAICKRIVERHHGWINVETAPGQGSTFTFALPKELPESA